MRIRTLLFTLILLCLLTTIQSTQSAAQNTTQWNLPECAIARLGKGIVHDIAFSPDGLQLAVVSSTGVWIYDALTGIEQALLIENNDRSVYDVVYSPDGQTIAVIGIHMNVQLWDTQTYELRGTLKGDAHYPTHVNFSPDGNTIAITDDGGTTQLWDAFTLKVKCILENSSVIIGEDGLLLFFTAFSPNGNMFAIGSEDGTVRLWDTTTGDLKHTLRSDLTSAVSFAFSPDGNTIAARSSSDSVLLWDTTTGKQKNTLEKTGSNRSIAYSPDGKTLTTTIENRVQLWDAATHVLKNTYKHTNTVFGIEYSPNGNTLATISGKVKREWLDSRNRKNRYSDHYIVSIWDTATGKHTSTLEVTDSVMRIAFSPDGYTIATASVDNNVQVWDTTTGREKYTLKHTSPIVGVSYSHDRPNILTSVHRDKTVWMWNTVNLTGKPTNKLTKHTNTVDSVAFSPDGNSFATGSRDGSILLWSTTTGTFKNTIEERRYTTKPFFVGAFSPDGETLACGIGQAAHLITIEPLILKEGIVKEFSSTNRIRSISYNPDGRRIFIGRDDRIEIWDTILGRMKGKIETGDRLRWEAPVMSPDGETIAISVSGQVQLWDITTETLKRKLPRLLSYPLAFSPDGKTIVTHTDWKHMVELYDSTSGKLTHRFTGHTGDVVDVAFSSDGNTLMTAGKDGTLLLWDLTSQNLNINKKD